MSAEELTRVVRKRAFELGFDAVGIARADVPLAVEYERYEAFLRRGMHGTMDYVAEHAEARRRLDTDAIIEGAKSVICLARRYARPRAEEASDPPLSKLIARYARGQDYHVFLRKKLRRLAAFVRTLAPDVDARAFCDTEPILERSWASRAGLGFIGKNGLLITPGIGSFTLLGEVVTTLELCPDAPIAERCGSCTRCLDACPTQAFADPFVLDARRCVSYLNIEHRGAIPPDLRERVGERLFGCDVCQEVCPFNRADPPPSESSGPFRALPRWAKLGLGDLEAMSEDQWAPIASGSPLHRAGRDGIVRNAAIVAESRLRRGAGTELACGTGAAPVERDVDAAREIAAEVHAGTQGGQIPGRGC